MLTYEVLEASGQLPVAYGRSPLICQVFRASPTSKHATRHERHIAQSHVESGPTQTNCCQIGVYFQTFMAKDILITPIDRPSGQFAISLAHERIIIIMLGSCYNCFIASYEVVFMALKKLGLLRNYTFFSSCAIHN